MLRTPPKKETLNKYDILSSPEPPSDAASADDSDGSPAGEEEDTPRPTDPTFGELDSLSDEEILKHIKLLQLLLQRRGLFSNPRNLSTKFNLAPTVTNPTNSQTRPVSPMDEGHSCPSPTTRTERPMGRKRQASAPSRIVVEAQIHVGAQSQNSHGSSTTGGSPKSPKRVRTTKSGSGPPLASRPVHMRPLLLTLTR